MIGKSCSEKCQKETRTRALAEAKSPVRGLTKVPQLSQGSVYHGKADRAVCGGTDLPGPFLSPLLRNRKGTGFLPSAALARCLRGSRSPLSTTLPTSFPNRASDAKPERMESVLPILPNLPPTGGQCSPFHEHTLDRTRQKPDSDILSVVSDEHKDILSVPLVVTLKGGRVV